MRAEREHDNVPRAGPAARGRSLPCARLARSLVTTLVGGATSLGCANATTVQRAPDGPPISRRFVRQATPVGASARLTPTEAGVRLRLFRSVVCEVVREDLQPSVDREVRTISTAGWIWAGLLAATGGYLLTKQDSSSRSSSNSDGSIGIVYLGGAGLLIGLAASRSGETRSPAPPTTTFAREHTTICPTAPLADTDVDVDVGGLIFQGKTDALGVLLVPLPMGQTRWRIRVEAVEIDDIKSE